jgi:hypothetical protein
VPVTVTDVPAAPTDGERRIVGVTPDARLDPNGTRSVAATMTIVAVAAQSRNLLLRRVLRLATSATHSDPSQKDNVVLHSATRLTSRVPWLCGPASRRVCSFVAALRGCARMPELRPGHRVDRLGAPYSVGASAAMTRSFQRTRTEGTVRCRRSSGGRCGGVGLGVASPRSGRDRWLSRQFDRPTARRQDT